MADFITPAFLENADEDIFHSKMLALLPEDIDKSEGSPVWDLTRPTAMVAAELVEFVMLEAVKMIFPQYASDEYLDYHGEARGISRKEAIASTGTVEISGTAGTSVRTGTSFSTLVNDDGDQESVYFESTMDVVISSTGKVDCPVKCTHGGTIGNVAANTILNIDDYISGVSSVTNNNAVSGGVDEESDEDYSKRILEYDHSRDVSYAGTISDYKRWANEVTGVGDVSVVTSNDGTGLVTLVITDSSGQPAGSDLRTSVYDYIMSPEDPNSRLAPINASLSVVAPETLSVTISAVIELENDGSLDKIRSQFLSEITSYLKEAKDDGEIRYSKVGKILAGIKGVYDYGTLKVNNGTTNVSIASNKIPNITSSNITFTSGTV